MGRIAGYVVGTLLMAALSGVPLLAGDEVESDLSMAYENAAVEMNRVIEGLDQDCVSSLTMEEVLALVAVAEEMVLIGDYQVALELLDQARALVSEEGDE